jgi:hypothetical protein
MDDLGVLPFQETSIYIYIYIYILIIKEKHIIMGLTNPLMEYMGST